MDRNKIDQQLDRRVEKIDLKNAILSGREPITDYDRYSFRSNIFHSFSCWCHVVIINTIIPIDKRLNCKCIIISH